MPIKTKDYLAKVRNKNIFLSLLALTGGLYAQADTLSDVQAKGSLSCGVSSGLVGFSSTSGLQDSLTYMYYTSKCLYMSLLYKYIQLSSSGIDKRFQVSYM
jgi:hypothetical protein